MAFLSVFSTNWLQILLKITLSVVIGFVLVAVGSLAIVWIRRWLRYRGEKRHLIKLTNQGNVASFFHLTARSQEPRLRFRFFLDQLPLPEITEEIELPSPMLKRPAAVVTAAQPESKYSTPVRMPTEQSKSDTLQAVKGGSEAAKSAIAKTGAIASLLGVIGGLLPGSLGKVIKEQGAAARGIQTRAKGVMDEPQALQNKLGQMQKDSGKLGIKTPASLPTSFNQERGAETIQPTSVQASPVSNMVSSAAPVTQTVRYFRSIAVEPGETLNVLLEIGSRKRIFPKGSYPYTVSSLQVPIEKFDKELNPVLQDGIVHFNRVSIWRYLLLDLLSFVFFAGFLMAIIYSISLVWA